MKLLSVCLFTLAVGVTANGQRVSVYSEFQRVRPDGAVVAADRVERSREILSPAVARNGSVTYRVAVEAPAGVPYYLYLAQNPDDTVRYTLYQEEYTKLSEEWVPTRVKPLELPVTAVLSEGQKVQTYLLDMFVPATAPAARFRLEIQVGVGERWAIYPMEVRVREALAPGKATARATLPAHEARADAAGMVPLREYLCGDEAPKEAAPADDVRAFVERNMRQDLLLAAVHERMEPRDGVMGMLLKAGGWPTLESFCKPGAGAAQLAPRGAEWWLRARAYLIQSLPVE